MSQSTDAMTSIDNKNDELDKEEEKAATTTSKQAASSENNGSHRPSLSVRLIRHAESYNNQVYRNARYIYRGGTPEFDEVGWTNYVDSHRQADPGLSDTGSRQAAKLAKNYWIPHVLNQVSQPLTIISSPMKRTLATIRPTLQGLQQRGHEMNVVVHGFYFESEGCHIRDVPQEGMNPQQIRQFLQQTNDTGDNKHDDEKANNDKNDAPHHNNNSNNVSFVGFPSADPNRGWYSHGTGAETRAASEIRAAKFYVWLCDYLDEQLLQGTRKSNVSSSSSSKNTSHAANQETSSSSSSPPHHDVFDAGVSVPGEEMEVDHDRLAPRQRKRRTVLLMGHGDFMSLVLKRIVAGFGHHVEHDGVPHRSAFVHYNTGMTELEYFGHGRFLVMSHNSIPHLQPPPPQPSPVRTIVAAPVDNQDDEEEEDYASLLTGGSLKDGWSYLMPNDEFILDGEVAVAFSDEQLQDNEHVREQTMALKSLYHLASESAIFQEKYSPTTDNNDNDDGDFLVEQQQEPDVGLQKDEKEPDDKSHDIHFIVQRGLQVVGVATYSERTGIVSDVAVRPSGGRKATETLLRAIKDHAQRKLGRSGSLLIQPRRTMDLVDGGGNNIGGSAAAATNVMNQQLLDELGFEPVGAAAAQPKMKH